MATAIDGILNNIGTTVGGAVIGAVAKDGCSLLNDIYNSTIGGAVDAALNGLYSVLGSVRSATEMVAQMVGVPLAAVKKYFSLQGSGALGMMNGFMSQYPCGAAADLASVIKGGSPSGPLGQFQANGQGSFLGSIASQVGISNLPGFGARGSSIPATGTLGSITNAASNGLTSVISKVNKGVDSAVDSAGSYLKSLF